MENIEETLDLIRRLNETQIQIERKLEDIKKDQEKTKNDINVKLDLLNSLKSELNLKQEEYDGLNADLEQYNRAYTQKKEENIKIKEDIENLKLELEKIMNEITLEKENFITQMKESNKKIREKKFN